MNFIFVDTFTVVIILLFVLIGGILIISQIKWKSFVASLDKAMFFYSL